MVMQVGRKGVGWAEFFRLGRGVASSGDVSAQAMANSNNGPQKEQNESAGSADSPVPAVAPAAFVQPLYISKVNTVFQLCLIAGCIGHSWYGWPPEDLLWALGGLTAFTTVGSFAAYLRAYRQGKLLSS